MRVRAGRDREVLRKRGAAVNPGEAVKRLSEIRGYRLFPSLAMTSPEHAWGGMRRCEQGYEDSRRNLGGLRWRSRECRLRCLRRLWRGPRVQREVGPWDTTLNLIRTDLSGPVAHALVTSAFVGSGVLYATGGGHGPGVSRLAAAGLGGAAALGAVQVMGWLFPYSPMLF